MKNLKFKSLYFIIGKFNLILLIVILCSFVGQKIFADTLVDKKKAYDICMEYHPPRIQNLCDQITSATTYEQLLNFHTNKGYSEVEAEKDNLVKSSNTNSTSNSTDSSSNSTDSSSNSTDSSSNSTDSSSNDTDSSSDDAESNSNDTESVDADTPEKKASEITPKEKSILSFAYSSFFWAIVNVVLVAFFIITYAYDRYKYFKRKREMKNRSKKK